MGRIEIDERRAPVIVVTYPSAVTIDDYRDVFRRFDEIAMRTNRIAWLIDFRSFNPVLLPPSVRRAAAGVFEEHRAVLAPVTACEVRVVGSVVARAILTAFDWMTPHKWPVANVGTFAEAEAWIARRMALASTDHRRP